VRISSRRLKPCCGWFFSIFIRLIVAVLLHENGYALLISWNLQKNGQQKNRKIGFRFFVAKCRS
jgi:hypothetical protein